jgi:hypothetical protein
VKPFRVVFRWIDSEGRLRNHIWQTPIPRVPAVGEIVRLAPSLTHRVERVVWYPIEECVNIDMEEHDEPGDPAG